MEEANEHVEETFPYCMRKDQNLTTVFHRTWKFTFASTDGRTCAPHAFKDFWAFPKLGVQYSTREMNRASSPEGARDVPFAGKHCRDESFIANKTLVPRQ